MIRLQDYIVKVQVQSCNHFIWIILFICTDGNKYSIIYVIHYNPLEYYRLKGQNAGFIKKIFYFLLTPHQETHTTDKQQTQNKIQRVNLENNQKFIKYKHLVWIYKCSEIPH